MTSLDYDDLPELEPDFAYPLLATQLATVLQRPRAGGFVLGLHGPWGSGKTTLMTAIRRQLAPASIIVDFNAWKYQGREALWRALILRVLEELANSGGDKDRIAEMQRSLYQSFSVTERGPLKVNWTAAITETLLGIVSIASLGIGGTLLERAAHAVTKVFAIEPDKEKAKEAGDRVERVSKIMERKTTERAVQQLVSIEQFLTRYRELTADLGKDGRRIHVLIDDLDRCLPDTALDIFEATKLFLDAPECTYVVAVDRAVIRRGLELRYPRPKDVIAPPVVDADEYIEKTITLSFDLPMLAQADGRKLMEKGAGSLGLTDGQIATLMDVLGTNPRRLKRFSGLLRLWFGIAAALPEADRKRLAFSPLEAANVDLFLKLSLIAYLNSGLITQMQRDPKLADRLQQAINGADKKNTPLERQQALVSAVEKELPVVRDAVMEPALGRAMRIEPNLANDPVTWMALGWFRAAAVQPAAPPTP